MKMHNKILNIFLLFAILGVVSPVMATTITNGANIDVSYEMANGGYDTRLFLNQDESFTVIFDTNGFSIYNDPFSNPTFTDTFSYDLSAFTIYGRIQDGQNAGNYFQISKDTSRYTADISGYLYLFNQNAEGVTFQTKDSGKIPAPATALLMLVGLTGLLVSRKRKSV